MSFQSTIRPSVGKVGMTWVWPVPNGWRSAERMASRRGVSNVEHASAGGRLAGWRFPAYFYQIRNMAGAPSKEAMLKVQEYK
jgi:hypothetical protein